MPGQPLSMEKTELMFQAYCDKQSANHVATKVGVSHHTAVKYIRNGDPDRGIAPFVERHARVQREITRKTERVVVYSATKVNQATFSHLKLLDSLIQQALEKLDGRLKLKDLSLKDVAKAMQTRTMILKELAPLVKQTVTETTSVSGELDGKSPEDCSFYAEHGFWPDSADASYLPSDSILSTGAGTQQQAELQPSAGTAQAQPAAQLLAPAVVSAHAELAPTPHSAAATEPAIGMRSGAEGDPSSGPERSGAPQQPGPQASPNDLNSPSKADSQSSLTLAQQTDAAARALHDPSAEQPPTQHPPHIAVTDDSREQPSSSGYRPAQNSTRNTAQTSSREAAPRSATSSTANTGDSGPDDGGGKAGMDAAVQSGMGEIGEGRDGTRPSQTSQPSCAQEQSPSYIGPEGEVITVPFACDGNGSCKYAAPTESLRRNERESAGSVNDEDSGQCPGHEGTDLTHDLTGYEAIAQDAADDHRVDVQDSAGEQYTASDSEPAASQAGTSLDDGQLPGQADSDRAAGCETVKLSQKEASEKPEGYQRPNEGASRGEYTDDSALPGPSDGGPSCTGTAQAEPSEQVAPEDVDPFGSFRPDS